MSFHSRSVPPNLTLRGELVEPLNLEFESRVASTRLDLNGKISPHLFRKFLLATALSQTSDITLQTDQAPRIKISGHQFRLDSKPWFPLDIQTALEELYGATNALAEIKSRKSLDFAYDLKIPRVFHQRFRVNATGIFGWDGSGVEISLRLLPQSTPTVQDVGLADEEIILLQPADGLVVIAGPTGSGKTSTLAAVIRHHVEKRTRPQKIIIIESPIEYQFRDLVHKAGAFASIIGQSEVGTHVVSFAAGVRSALRRNPDIIVIGEARDRTTINAAIEASLTGHLVYTTTHASSISDTIRRLLASNSDTEFHNKALDLASSLRVIMVQHLEPDVRSEPEMAVRRQSLQITPIVRKQLFASHPNSWPKLISSLIHAQATSGDANDR